MSLEEDRNLYRKADLEDYADFSHIEAEGRRDTSRRKLLANALEMDTDDIIQVREGGYQGTILFVFLQEDYLWLVKDSYGSCAGCDAFLAATDTESYREYAKRMCRNAYAFTDDKAAIQFLDNKADDGYEGRTFAYGWGPLVEDGIEAVKCLS